MPGFEAPFGVTVDLSFWQWFFNLPLSEAALVIFVIVGWAILAIIFLKLGLELLAEYKEHNFMRGWNWVLLAVDIPPLFIQTPKAIEQIFSHLSGALSHATVVEKFWIGKKQKWFSFEIISIEGYIQFLVRTEAQFRDLVEAAIYAQYAEAEITEVEDYVSNIPDRYPNGDYDVLGVEFKLAAQNVFPIRTYQYFEYNISKEAVFSDPMAALLENFTRIGHGENLWLQIIIEPTANNWKEDGIALAKELMGHESAHHGSPFLSMIGSLPQELMKEFFNALSAGGEEHAAHKEEKKPKVEVTPGTKSTVEAIEEKIAKIGFKTKLRALYAARAEVYNPSRCLQGLVGAVNQFNDANRNALVPAMETHAHYDRKHKKSFRLKNTFVKAFKARKMRWKKFQGYILNIEELATIWHFPLPFVKTPLLHRAGYKRAEPPSGLPVELRESPLKKKTIPPAPEAPDALGPAAEPELPYA